MQGKGTIIRSTGSWYNIRLENDEIVQGRLRGKFKLKGLITSGHNITSFLSINLSTKTCNNLVNPIPKEIPFLI